MPDGRNGKDSGLDLNQAAAIRTGMAPLYHSLGHVIRGKIESGEWQIDQTIPSERALVEMLGISRATVRQGIENLVKEGILYRMQGKGTFVAPPKVEQGTLRLLDFVDTMKRNGLNPSARLLGKGRVDPPPNVRKALGLAPDEQAVWFQRLLMINAVPMLIESAYFSTARYPELLESYDGSDAPHRFIYQHYGVQVTRAHEVFEPVILESAEAALLGVKSGFPALWVEHLAFDIASNPVAFLSSLMRGDRCRFYTDLTLSEPVTSS